MIGTESHLLIFGHSNNTICIWFNGSKDNSSISSSFNALTTRKLADGIRDDSRLSWYLGSYPTMGLPLSLPDPTHFVEFPAQRLVPPLNSW